MNFKVIITAIIMITLVANVAVLAQSQYQKDSSSILDLVSNTKSRISEISILSIDMDKTLLEKEIQDIDYIFNSLQKSKLPSGEDIIISENTRNDLDDTLNQWNVLKNTLIIPESKKAELTHVDLALNYVLNKEQELSRLTENIHDEFSSLDDEYIRHKEIVPEIQKSISNIDLIFESITSGSTENFYKQIHSNRITIDSDVKKLLQIPLDDLELEQQIKSETLQLIPRQNSKALNEFDFVWESVRVRVLTVELLLLPDGGFGGILKVPSTESVTENLILSIDNLYSSWSNDSPQVISQNNDVLYPIIGLDVIAFIAVIVIHRKFKVKSAQLLMEPELVIEPELIPKPIIEPEPIIFPADTPKPIIEPELIPKPIIEPELIPKPIIEPEPIIFPEDTPKPTPEPTPEPIIEPTPEPIIEPEPTSLPEIIIIALHNYDKMTHQQIYEEILKHHSTIQRETMRARLSELRKKGLVKRDDDGLWNLEQKGYKEYDSLKQIAVASQADVIPQAEMNLQKSTILDEGISLFINRKYVEASKFFENILSQDPKNQDALYHKGRSQSYLYNHDMALKCFDELLQINSKHIEGLYHKGIELSIIGKHSESVNTFNSVLNLDENHKDSLLNKGRSLAILGKNNEAITCYDKVLDKDLKNTEALYLKGSLLQKTLRNDEAIVCYQNVIEIEPNHKLSHYNLGLIFTIIREYEKAIKCFNTTLSLDKNHKDSIFQKGLLLLVMGELSESETMFDKVLKIDSKHQGALYHKGFVLSMLDNYEASLEYLDNSLKLIPTDVKSLSIKAFSLIKLKKYNEAISCCEKIIDLEPKNGNAYYNLAKIKAQQNEDSNSLHYLRQAIQINTKYAQMSESEPVFKKIL